MMSYRLPSVLVALAALTLGPAASANDSTAELTTGGLVLSKNADIEMRSEDLAISEKEISVRYKFFNHAASDQTVTVAFPMPDVTLVDRDIAFPARDPANFLDFHTVADGHEVRAQYEQKAVLDGTDISARLKAFGLPLAVQNEATSKALDALPRARQDELEKLGFVTAYEEGAGKDMVHRVTPQWTFKSTFYWNQTFPAGREIGIEHRYVPSVGEAEGSMLNSTPIDAAALREYEALYCVDKDFLASAKTGLGKPDADGQPAHPFYEKRIAYVLKTAANWAKPIGEFRLTVDKGAPDALVSFCAEGVKKIGPTVFEVSHENFTPTRDLHILILYRPKT
jgi:hypothetical protein